MKILLVAVNAKYIHSNLAVYSLKAAAQAYAEQIEIAEYTINQQIDIILKDIYTKQPDMVAFSCYIWNRRVVDELVGELPKLLKGVTLWVGGPEVSYEAEDYLKKHRTITGVMQREGEKTFCRLSSYYIEETGSLFEIPGIVFRTSEGEICKTEDASVLDLDQLPFVYQDFTPFQHKIIYYESSRGCPFACSYCLSSLEQRVRYRSLSLVKEELSIFLTQKVPQVKFVDRTFNLHPDRTKELWSWLIEHDNFITNFHFEIAADLLTEEELTLMGRMRPGLIQLEIGVQSTNPATICEIDRTMNLSRLKENVRRIKAYGTIHQHLDLIAGLPGEDLRSFQKSFDEIFALEPEQLQLGFLKVLKGTKMHKKAKEYGIICHEFPPYEVLSTRWLTYQEILLLKGVEEMVEIYYNSGQFIKTIQEILKRYDSPFDFFHELAVYYEDNGYEVVSHSRMARYEILRTFLKEKGLWERIYDRCMVYDLYIRENLKSRPSFAANLTPYKDKLKAYTKQYGRQVHIEVFEEERPVFVLFDYQRRNPFTKQAYVEVLD